MKKSVEKGITLIALVVTIVVLLILAGISISMLTGENGIISQARKSKEETIIGDEKEGISLAYSSCKTDNLMENVTASQLEERMKADGKDVTVTQDGLDLKVRYPKTGHEYTVNQNGKIEEDLSNPDEIIDGIYVKDYAILEKKSGEVLYVEINDNEGIIDTENATVITKDGIAQKCGGYFVDRKGKVYGWKYNDDDSRRFECISDEENSILNDKVIKQIYVNEKSKKIAIDVDGKVYTWGFNEDGELGDGTTENREIPVCISDIEGSILKGKKIIFVDNANYSTFVVDEEGKVYAWGYNQDGQLGDGTTEDKLMPVCISDIEGSILKGKKIERINTINYAEWTLVIDEEGKVYAWGDNIIGQLGDGTTEDKLMPICISDIEGSDLKGKKIVKFDYSISGGYTFALDVDGYIYMWEKGKLPTYVKVSNEKLISSTYVNYRYLLDKAGNLYTYNFKNEQRNEIVLSSVNILTGKKISSIFKRDVDQIFVVDSEGIGYLKGYGYSDEFVQINTKDEYRIIKANSVEDEQGVLYMTDNEEIYYITLKDMPDG